jgi:hypothetical protein
MLSAGLRMDGLPLQQVLGADRVELAEHEGRGLLVAAVALGPVDGGADAQPLRGEVLERRRRRGVCGADAAGEQEAHHDRGSLHLYGSPRETGGYASCDAYCLRRSASSSVIAISVRLSIE